MSESNPLTRRAASNLEAVKMDLAASYTQGNEARAKLLQTLLSCGGRILLYRPQLQHYAVLLGDLDSARVTWPSSYPGWATARTCATTGSPVP